MPNKIVTKGQLKLLIFTNVVIFATIAVIIYEMSKKVQHFTSYIMLGFVFFLMAANQYMYYKNNNTKKNLISCIFFVILGFTLIVYKLFLS